MANLAPVAADVVADEGFTYVDGIIGETLTAGAVVYQKAADQRYWLAHCETSLATSTVVGIALNGGGAGQPVRVMKTGTITIGATVGIGTQYILSTAGLICPYGDLATADWVTPLAVATTTAKLKLGIFISGVQKAA